MLNNNNFYHASIKKYVAIFGSLFNDIYITREDANGVPYDTFKVPIAYGPRDKFLARVEEDTELNRPYALQLPRLSFELKNIAYNEDLKLTSTKRFASRQSTNPSSYPSVFNPVPFIFNFELLIYSKNAEDATKIVEQILPFFTPDYTVSAYMIDEMPDYKIDIPIIRTGIDCQDYYDGSFKQRRVLTWSINFIMKGYLWGPVKSMPIIKISKTNFRDSASNTAFETVIATPGLTANGQPTTDANNSINPLDIKETDLWDLAVTITYE